MDTAKKSEGRDATKVATPLLLLASAVVIVVLLYRFLGPADKPAEELPRGQVGAPAAGADKGESRSDSVKVPDWYASAMASSDTLIKQGNYDGAIKELGDLLNNVPSGQPKAGVHAMLATAYAGKTNTERSRSSMGTATTAVAHLNAALKEDPNDVSVLLGLGMAKYYLKEFEQSIAHLEQASRLEPNRADVWYYLSMANRRTGRTAEADRCMETSRRLDPNYKPPIPPIQ